jgi:hypothetical protein
MSGGAWAAWSLPIGYVALMGVGATAVLVRDGRFGYAVLALLASAFFAYMAFRAWSEALARWRRDP